MSKKQDRKRRRNHIRVLREKHTIKVMVDMYCSAKHGTPKGQLCDDCRQVLDYAIKKIDYCVWGIKKPACDVCPVHCFKDDMRQKMIEIMRYAGPRMTWKHPILAFAHLFDVMRGKKIRKLYEEESKLPGFNFKKLLDKI